MNQSEGVGELDVCRQVLPTQFFRLLIYIYYIYIFFFFKLNGNTEKDIRVSSYDWQSSKGIC